MPAAGLPVASMTMSISGASISAETSSVTHVAAFLDAAAKERAAKRADSHPVRASVARARAGSRSAMPTT